jgi:prepilin-type N-terminal cleavage/methylation domain-containing protein
MNYRHPNTGFTLIELLIVVSVIGVLAAVLVNVIGPKRAQGSARDGVRMANMEKLVQGLEAFYVAENTGYPTCCGSTNQLKTSSPTDMQDTAQADEVVETYIKNWPQAEGGTTFKYVYHYLGADSFVLSVKTERGPSSCLKYGATEGQIHQCKVCGSATTATCTEYY